MKPASWPGSDHDSQDDSDPEDESDSEDYQDQQHIVHSSGGADAHTEDDSGPEDHQDHLQAIASAGGADVPADTEDDSESEDHSQAVSANHRVPYKVSPSRQENPDARKKKHRPARPVAHSDVSCGGRQESSSESSPAALADVEPAVLAPQEEAFPESTSTALADAESAKLMPSEPSQPTSATPSLIVESGVAAANPAAESAADESVPAVPEPSDGVHIRKVVGAADSAADESVPASPQLLAGFLIDDPPRTASESPAVSTQADVSQIPVPGAVCPDGLSAADESLPTALEASAGGNISLAGPAATVSPADIAGKPVQEAESESASEAPAASQPSAATKMSEAVTADTVSPADSNEADIAGKPVREAESQSTPANPAASQPSAGRHISEAATAAPESPPDCSVADTARKPVQEAEAQATTEASAARQPSAGMQIINDAATAGPALPANSNEAVSCPEPMTEAVSEDDRSAVGSDFPAASQPSAGLLIGDPIRVISARPADGTEVVVVQKREADSQPASENPPAPQTLIGMQIVNEAAAALPDDNEAGRSAAESAADEPISAVPQPSAGLQTLDANTAVVASPADSTQIGSEGADQTQQHSAEPEDWHALPVGLTADNHQLLALSQLEAESGGTGDLLQQSAAPNDKHALPAGLAASKPQLLISSQAEAKGGSTSDLPQQSADPDDMHAPPAGFTASAHQLLASSRPEAESAGTRDVPQLSAETNDKHALPAGLAASKPQLLISSQPEDESEGADQTRQQLAEPNDMHAQPAGFLAGQHQLLISSQPEAKSGSTREAQQQSAGPDDMHASPAGVTAGQHQLLASSQPEAECGGTREVVQQSASHAMTSVDCEDPLLAMLHESAGFHQASYGSEPDKAGVAANAAAAADKQEPVPEAMSAASRAAQANPAEQSQTHAAGLGCKQSEEKPCVDPAQEHATPGSKLLNEAVPTMTAERPDVGPARKHATPGSTHLNDTVPHTTAECPDGTEMSSSPSMMPMTSDPSQQTVPAHHSASPSAAATHLPDTLPAARAGQNENDSVIDTPQDGQNDEDCSDEDMDGWEADADLDADLNLEMMLTEQEAAVEAGATEGSHRHGAPLGDASGKVLQDAPHAEDPDSFMGGGQSGKYYDGSFSLLQAVKQGDIPMHFGEAASSRSGTDRQTLAYLPQPFDAAAHSPLLSHAQTHAFGAHEDDHEMVSAEGIASAAVDGASDEPMHAEVAVSNTHPLPASSHIHTAEGSSASGQSEHRIRSGLLNRHMYSTEAGAAAATFPSLVEAELTADSPITPMAIPLSHFPHDSQDLIPLIRAPSLLSFGVASQQHHAEPAPHHARSAAPQEHMPGSMPPATLEDPTNADAASLTIGSNVHGNHPAPAMGTTPSAAEPSSVAQRTPMQQAPDESSPAAADGADSRRGHPLPSTQHMPMQQAPDESLPAAADALTHEGDPPLLLRDVFMMQQAPDEAKLAADDLFDQREGHPLSTSALQPMQQASDESSAAAADAFDQSGRHRLSPIRSVPIEQASNQCSTAAAVPMSQHAHHPFSPSQLAPLQLAADESSAAAAAAEGQQAQHPLSPTQLTPLQQAPDDSSSAAAHQLGQWARHPLSPTEQPDFADSPMTHGLCSPSPLWSAVQHSGSFPAASRNALAGQSPLHSPASGSSGGSNLRYGDASPPSWSGACAVAERSMSQSMTSPPTHSPPTRVHQGRDSGMSPSPSNASSVRATLHRISNPITGWRGPSSSATEGVELPTRRVFAASGEASTQAGNPTIPSASVPAAMASMNGEGAVGWSSTHPASALPSRPAGSAAGWSSADPHPASTSNPASPPGTGVMEAVGWSSTSPSGAVGSPPAAAGVGGSAGKRQREVTDASTGVPGQGARRRVSGGVDGVSLDRAGSYGDTGHLVAAASAAKRARRSVPEPTTPVLRRMCPPPQPFPGASPVYPTFVHHPPPPPPPPPFHPLGGRSPTKHFVPVSLQNGPQANLPCAAPGVAPSPAISRCISRPPHMHQHPTCISNGHGHQATRAMSCRSPPPPLPPTKGLFVPVSLKNRARATKPRAVPDVPPSPALLRSTTPDHPTCISTRHGPQEIRGVSTSTPPPPLLWGGCVPVSLQKRPQANHTSAAQHVPPSGAVSSGSYRAFMTLNVSSLMMRDVSQ